MLKSFILFLLLFLSPATYAWYDVGHEVIAQIAYDNLTPQAKVQADKLISVMTAYYPHSSDFILASAWADEITSHKVTAFSTWHYIDLPIDYRQHTQKHFYAHENVVWALQQSFQVLSSPRANQYEKALFLRFFIHFVGDIHQPLHAANYYSTQLPKGDKGGNLYRIQNTKYYTLHKMWDSCAGMVDIPHVTPSQIRSLATNLEKTYRQTNLYTEIPVTDFKQWAKESYQLAKDQAYTLPYNASVSEDYTQQVRQTCERRLALAGYRLADELNHIFSQARPLKNEVAT